MKHLLTILLLSVLLASTADSQTVFAPWREIPAVVPSGAVILVDSVRNDSIYVASLGTDFTVNITLSTVTRGYLVAQIVTPANNPPSIDSVYIGTTYFTLLDTAKYATGGDARIFWFGLVSPGNGVKTLSFKAATTGVYSVFLMHFEHVNQTIPYISGGFSGGYTNTLTKNITVATNDLGLSVVMHNTTTSFTPTSPMEKYAQALGSDVNTAYGWATGYITGNGTVATTWTASVSQIMIMQSGTLKHD